MHIDDLFRSKEQPFVALPAAAWEDMKLRLDQNQPKNGFLNRWIWYVLLLLLVLGISFYLLMSRKDQENTGIASPDPVVSLENSGKTASTISGTPILSQAGFQKKTPARAKGYSRNLGRGRTGGNSHLSETGMGLWPDRAGKQVILPEPALLANRYASLKNDTAKDSVTGISAVLAAKVPALSAPDADPRVSPMHSFISLPGAALLPLAIKRPGVIPLTSRVMSLPYSRAESSSEPLQADVPAVAHVVHKDTTALSFRAAGPKSTDSKLPVKETGNAPVFDTRPGEKDSLPVQNNRKRLPIAFGFKAGYAVGTSKPSVNKVLFAPYLQYGLGNRFSLTLQPTIKYGTFVGTLSPKEKSYYNTTGTTVDSQTITKNGHPFWQITYTHSYDSIIVQYKPAGNTIEIALPLILQYHLKKGIFFDAGLDFALGKLITIEEQKQTVPMTQTAVFQIEKAGTHPPPDTSKSFHHSVPPYAAYVPPGPTDLSPLRVGYLLGIGYEHKKWLLEGYLQQSVLGLSGITQPDVKKAYQIPYLHFMLGYRLSKK